MKLGVLKTCVCYRGIKRLRTDEPKYQTCLIIMICDKDGYSTEEINTMLSNGHALVIEDTENVSECTQGLVLLLAELADAASDGKTVRCELYALAPRGRVVSAGIERCFRFKGTAFRAVQGKRGLVAISPKLRALHKDI